MKSSDKKELSTNVKYVTSIIAAVSALEIILARFLYINNIHFGFLKRRACNIIVIYPVGHNYYEHT